MAVRVAAITFQCALTAITFQCALTGLHLLCLAAPFTFSWFNLKLCAVLYFLTGCLGIVIGYHRQVIVSARGRVHACVLRGGRGFSSSRPMPGLPPGTG
jgi:fatty-acid desaturase